MIRVSGWVKECTKRAVIVICLLCFAVSSATSQGKQPAAKSKKHISAKNSVAARLDVLQTAIVLQQHQIESLQDEIATRDLAIHELHEQVAQSQDLAAAAQAKAELAIKAGIEQQSAVASVGDEVLDLKPKIISTESALQQTQKTVTALEHPPVIQFKGITITPGGFIELAGIYRTHNENADVTSTFGNVPFSGSANSFLSEFRATARQSRITLLAEGKTNNWKLSGYYEADFLGAAPTANEVESNSFNPRQRQLWGQVEFNNGFSFLAGQSWSLLTTDRRGLGALHEMIPLTIDSQYVVGYNWTRQPGVRITKDFNDHVWVAFAAENPETALNVTNPPPGVLGLNNSTNAQSPNSQFTLSNVPGANGISTDLAPDLIAKVVFEPGWGHYEIKTIGRFFRDRSSGTTNITAGGGGGIAAVLPITKKFDAIFEGLAGTGIGRYGASVGPDVTLRPNGTIVPIRALQTMAGLEFHPSSTWDLYVYGGDEYYSRTDYVDSSGKGVGYGSPLVDNSGCSVEIPSSTQLCQAQTRSIWQVQPGFWHRFYKGPGGTAQFGISYSYTYRGTWTGANGLQPKGIENMIMTSFRYYLP